MSTVASTTSSSSSSKSSSSSSPGMTSCSSASEMDGTEEADDDDDESSGLRRAGADACALTGPPGGTRLRIRACLLASISAAPLNLGIKGIGMFAGGGALPLAAGAAGAEGAGRETGGPFCTGDASSTLISTSTARLATSAFLGEDDAGSVGVASGSPPSPTAGRGCDSERLTDSLRGIEIDPRFPLTRSPSAPARDGPMMVVVYLRPVAPGKPVDLLGRPPFASSSLGGGLLGMASSGHLSTSANPASTTYGFER